MHIVKVIGLALFLVACGEPTENQPASSSDVVAETRTGVTVFNQFCFSCHAAGVAGAPRLGVKEDWAPRVALVREVMMSNIIEGMPPAMPPKGLCNQCSEEELENALDYMLNSIHE